VFSDLPLPLLPIEQTWADCQIFLQDPPGFFQALEGPELYCRRIGNELDNDKSKIVKFYAIIRKKLCWQIFITSSIKNLLIHYD